MGSSNLLTKQNMNPQQLAIVGQEFAKKAKSKTTAYLFWFFLGALGAHRFYVGDKTRGFFMLITLGGIGIWALIDVFFIGSRVEEVNEKIEADVLATVQSPN